MLPYLSPHARQGIGKGRLCLGVPRGRPDRQLAIGIQCMGQQSADRIQSQQPWRGALSSLVRPLSLGCKTEVGTAFLKGRLNCPACNEGHYQVTGQEMATAAQYGINIITVGYNNSALATIRMHQEAQSPNRPSGPDFVTPDCAALGTASRALGSQVTRDHAFLPALREALQATPPALIEVMTDKPPGGIVCMRTFSSSSQELCSLQQPLNLAGFSYAPPMLEPVVSF